MLLGAFLTRDDLVAFGFAASTVLSDRDPLIGLDLTRRLAAQMAGTSQQFSNTLRYGLARTLALLGAAQSPIPRLGNRSGPDWARAIVHDLLDSANADNTYALWTSLGDVMTLLAEAAPEDLLQALLEGLTGPSPLHANMFADSANDHGFPTSSPHLQFLAALELLAWSPEYLDSAADILARLAALDPDGKWSNRPSRSLAEIFSCWRPNTIASEQQRIQALQRILQNEPAVGRQLLITLIPTGRELQTPHPAPQFRDWKVEVLVTHADLSRFQASIIDMLLDTLGDDPDHYLAIVERLGSLSLEQQAAFADHLVRVGRSCNDDEARARLRNALRDIIARDLLTFPWVISGREVRD